MGRRQQNRGLRWRSYSGKAIFETVKRRSFRPLVYALVAVQLLLSVPVASAWAAEVSAQAPVAQSMPCDDMSMLADEQHSRHCPCCPDGAMGAMDCQTACAAGAAVLPSAHYFRPCPVAIRSVEPVPVNFLPLAEPPLKPPPII
jgi:hypothetical protein